MIHKPKLGQKLYQDSCLNDVKICERASSHFLKLRICVYPNPLRKRGIAFRGLRRVAGNPSLTLRVVINPSVSPQVNNLSAETRNFKTDTFGQWRTPANQISENTDPELQARSPARLHVDHLRHSSEGPTSRQNARASRCRAPRLRSTHFQQVRHLEIAQCHHCHAARNRVAGCSVFSARSISVIRPTSHLQGPMALRLGCSRG